MPDEIPGFDTIKNTEEVQIWGSGPDNQHQRFTTRAHIKSTSTDAGNTPTTTLRGGLLMAVKDSDGLVYPFSAAAIDGTNRAVGLLNRHVPMLDRYGAVKDKWVNLLKGGLLQNVASDVINLTKGAMATLLRSGFHSMGLAPHGSAFLMQPLGVDYKTADYTVLDADHGKLLIANGSGAINFTLPTLSTVTEGFMVWLFNAANQNMVVTAAADTILYDDTSNGKSTTLTFSTSSQKLGAAVLMRATYDGGSTNTLSWLPLAIQRTVVGA